MRAKLSSFVVSYFILGAALVRAGLDFVRHNVGFGPQGWQHEITYYSGCLYLLFAILAIWRPRPAAVAGLSCYALLFTYFILTVGGFIGFWIWFELATVALLSFALGFAFRRTNLPLGRPATTGARWGHLIAAFLGTFAVLPTGAALVYLGLSLAIKTSGNGVTEHIVQALSLSICAALLLVFTVRRRLAAASAGVVLASALWIAANLWLNCGGR